MKECWIYNKSRDLSFYGMLDTSLADNGSYSFIEIPDSMTGRKLNHDSETDSLVIDFQAEYDEQISYQKLAFKEFRDEILNQIKYAELIGNTATVSELTTALIAEKTAYENRVLAITLETE